MLGGMWGMHNSVNRSLSMKVFNLLMDPKIVWHYNKRKTSPVQGDQSFLAARVYPWLLSQSIVHDSYWCKKYSNSRPFPTQRVVMDHVGSVKSNINVVKNISECPLECRPPEHKDWKYC